MNKNSKGQQIATPEETRCKGSKSLQINKVLSALRISPHTAVELNYLLRFSDARKRISELRALGYPISDYWVKTEYSRHKIYFLK